MTLNSCIVSWVWRYRRLSHPLFSRVQRLNCSYDCTYGHVDEVMSDGESIEIVCYTDIASTFDFVFTFFMRVVFRVGVLICIFMYVYFTLSVMLSGGLQQYLIRHRPTNISPQPRRGCGSDSTTFHDLPVSTYLVVSKVSSCFRAMMMTVAYLPLGQIGHGPLWPKNVFFDVVKKLENLVWPSPFWNPKYANGWWWLSIFIYTFRFFS